MKDIPVFSTDWGVASLILKEILYRGIAYVKVQDVQPGQIRALCQECGDFCRAAGADRVIALGHGDLEGEYPLYASVWNMSLALSQEQTSPACLFPVTEQTVGRWREIYNTRMTGVDFAVTQTKWDEANILSSGGAYFVHDQGQCLGIGWMEGNKILALASVRPGAGETVLRALCTLVPGDRVELQVASTNHRAIRLYEAMGFVKTGVAHSGYGIR